MIGFVGLSHLGLVTSIAVASKGFEVLGYDPNAELTKDLENGKLPVFEPNLDDLLSKNKKSISFTSDASKLKGCELVYFSLDVKTDERNVSDLAPLEALIKGVASALAPNAILVLLSQVPPGFSRRILNDLGGRQLVYQVETLIFGRAVERALYPERYIIGLANPEAPLPEPLAKLLESFDCPVLPMRYESAELAKISINLCLVSSISVANTLAEICENIGAEWTEIAPALKLDKRIGQYSYLSPGLGIAGGNLERDLITVKELGKKHGTDTGVVDAWIANNKHRLDWVLRTLHSKVLSQKKNPTLAVWGLAYKQDTKSTKNSPSLHLLKSLADFHVQACDPQVVMNKNETSAKFAQVAGPLESAAKADALIIMTPWKVFGECDLAQVKRAMAGKTVIDPYAVLNLKACQAQGFDYYRLGSRT